MTQTTIISTEDVTEAVLDSVLTEALSLTDEIAAAGASRRAAASPDSFDCAQRLRLAARLSRIAAWASLRASRDPERLAVAAAALDSALRGDRHASAAIAPAKAGEGVEGAAENAELLAPLKGKVARLADRARRLDALLDGGGDYVEPAVAAMQIAETSAVILPFRPR